MSVDRTVAGRGTAQGSGPDASVVVVQYDCPVARRPMWAIWDGDLPLVGFNAFLRAHAHFEANTRRRKAYALLTYARFLKRNDQSVLHDVARTRSPLVELYRNSLDQQRRDGRWSDETAEQYLHEVFLLCLWWRQDSEPLLGTTRRRKSRGFLSHATTEQHVLPPEFRLPPRRALRARPSEKTLTEAEVVELAALVLVLWRPRPRRALRQQPTPAWAPTRRRRWASAKRAHEREALLCTRNLALWWVMLAAGFRLSEVGALMLEDVVRPDASPDRVYLYLRYRPASVPYSRLKTGPRDAYLFLEQAVRALDEWLIERARVMRRATAAGQPDHGFLFTKVDGSPLTAGCIVSMLRAMKRRLPAAPTPSPGRQRVRTVLYAHLLRHTTTTMMRSNGVPAEFMAAQLGHQSLATTAAYGTVFEARRREALDRLVHLGAGDAGRDNT